MDAQRAQEIATAWANEAGAQVKARVALHRALVSLVRDQAPVEVLIDDDTVPLVGRGWLRLLLATARADEQTDPTAECRAVALDGGPRSRRLTPFVSLSRTACSAAGDGLWSRNTAPPCRSTLRRRAAKGLPDS